MSPSWQTDRTKPWDLLFLGEINLETYNIAVLDFTLGKRQFLLHKLDHAWFNFLQDSWLSMANPKIIQHHVPRIVSAVW